MTTSCRSRSARAHMHRRWIRRTHSERGSTTVELVVIVPALMTMLLLVVYVGRLTQANAAVTQAADHAARAAALSARPAMSGEAQSAAVESLSGTTCLDRHVVVAVGPQVVTATVTCTIKRSDLAPLAPGQQTVSASSTEVIDVRRGE